MRGLPEYGARRVLPHFGQREGVTSAAGRLLMSLPGGAGFLGPSVGLVVGVFCLRPSGVSLAAVLVRVARRLPVFACLASLPPGFPPRGV